jgi:hypothetical protein
MGWKIYCMITIHGITDVEKVPVQSQMLKVESDEEI